MSELQHKTDMEQAKAKLQEVAETKENRKDTRGSDMLPSIPARRTGRIPDEEREISIGKIKPKKKPFGQKLKEAMFSEDIGNGSVTEYLFFKLMIPSLKRLLADMGNTALNMALGLDPKTRTFNGGATHTANARVYSDRQYGSRPTWSSRRGILDEDEWDEMTAKDYFNQMLETADKYGDLSVTNVYSICGLQERIRTTDRNWGWTPAMLNRADCICVDVARDRWVILLPEPRDIGR